MLVAQVVDLLDGLNELGVLEHRVVAQDVHVEANALLDERLANASGADHRDGLACHLVAHERQVGMPVIPAVLAHQLFRVPQLAGERGQNEESELGGGLGEHVGSVGEGNLVAVGVGAIDVVEADRNLRDDFQRALPSFEDLGVDLVADGGDEAVHA